MKLAPFISQIAGVPSSFCQRMSALPSPLKSPVARDVPARSRVRQTPASNEAGAVHQPDRGRAVAVLPENVGLAVAVEVAGPRDVPARSRVRQSPASNEAGAVHQPDRELRAVIGLPENVGLAVAVEVASPRDVPVRSEGALQLRLQ